VSGRICKDCVTEWEAFPEPKGPVTYRPRPIVDKSGGRCATHWRIEKERRKDAAHENRVGKVYGLEPGRYQQIWHAQNGVCAICQRATGRTRRLSVDHDHESGLVRGLLCRPCNDMLGHCRDNANMLFRAVHYLDHPPAIKLGIFAYHEENRGEDG